MGLASLLLRGLDELTLPSNSSHMKYILFISIVILTSCFSSNSDSDYEKFSVDKSKIDFIEIRKRGDTVSLRLSENQVDSLIAKLENSEPKRPSYVSAEYYLKIHFIDGYTIEYATQQGTVRGNGGITYKINDKKFYKNLWFEQVDSLRETLLQIKSQLSFSDFWSDV